MDPGKQINSDAASAENDPQPEKSNDDENTGVGRSYGCTFCKRGFTNAQALGGHMNIHRKDKAKAKQKNNQEEPSSKNTKTSEDHASSRYSFGQVQPVDQPQQREHRRPVDNYQDYNYFPSSNPSFLSENYRSRLPFWRLENKEDGKKDENLSLRIGFPPAAEEGRKENEEENDQIDLELRLGHDP